MNQTSSIDQFANRWGDKWDIRWKILTAVFVTFILTLLVTLAVMSINVTQPVNEKALDPLILEHVLARRYEETRIREPESAYLSTNPELKVVEGNVDDSIKGFDATKYETIQLPSISPAVLDNVMRRRNEENVLK